MQGGYGGQSPPPPFHALKNYYEENPPGREYIYSVSFVRATLYIYVDQILDISHLQYVQYTHRRERRVFFLILYFIYLLQYPIPPLPLLVTN